MRIHPARFDDGTPAPFHCLDGLPDEAVLLRLYTGRVLHAKPLVPGFERGGFFYTRRAASRACEQWAAASPGSRERRPPPCGDGFTRSRLPAERLPPPMAFGLSPARSPERAIFLSPHRRRSSMSKTMKAAVVREFEQPLVIEEVPVPTPRAGQVLVKIEASGVCHTDLHAAEGDWPVKPKPRSSPAMKESATSRPLAQGSSTSRKATASGSPGSTAPAAIARTAWPAGRRCATASRTPATR